MVRNRKLEGRGEWRGERVEERVFIGSLLGTYDHLPLSQPPGQDDAPQGFGFYASLGYPIMHSNSPAILVKMSSNVFQSHFLSHCLSKLIPKSPLWECLFFCLYYVWELLMWYRYQSLFFDLFFYLCVYVYAYVWVCTGHMWYSPRQKI